MNDLEFDDLETDDFNSDDYILADEEHNLGKYVELMNIFTIHFRDLFKKDPTLNIFQGVDYNKLDSTNRQMELFYEYLMSYKENQHNDDRISIYPVEDIDINKCKELYILKFKDQEYACQFIIPLLSYLSEQDYKSDQWSILPIKRKD